MLKPKGKSSDRLRLSSPFTSHTSGASALKEKMLRRAGSLAAGAAARAFAPRTFAPVVSYVPHLPAQHERNESNLVRGALASALNSGPLRERCVGWGTPWLTGVLAICELAPGRPRGCRVAVRTGEFGRSCVPRVELLTLTTSPCGPRPPDEWTLVCRICCELGCPPDSYQHQRGCEEPLRGDLVRVLSWSLSQIVTCTKHAVNLVLPRMLGLA